MGKTLLACATFALLSGAGVLPANSIAATVAAPGNSVEFERMTWPEVKDALARGKTTALIYTGGTEQRGPQNPMADTT